MAGIAAVEWWDMTSGPNTQARGKRCNGNDEEDDNGNDQGQDRSLIIVTVPVALDTNHMKGCGCSGIGIEFAVSVLGAFDGELARGR